MSSDYSENEQITYTWKKRESVYKKARRKFWSGYKNRDNAIKAPRKFLSK